MLDLTERDKCFVIAEAGTCHAAPSHNPYHRKLSTAKEYVSAAADCGANAIKFQIFNDPITEDMFCWVDGDDERLPRWRASCMSLDGWREIKWYAEARDIMFLASVFQHSTVEWLNELGVEATKVASRAAKDFPYGKAPEPYLISDGMYKTFPQKAYEQGGCILQCEAEYPSTEKWHGYFTGFSDHSGNPWYAIDAISRDCPLIEVHFYINEEDAGPDLPASLNLDELKLVCDARDNFAELRNAA